jgi:hypothetical protein
MGPPFPHPITAEGQRKDLVVIRPTPSLLGGEGGGEKAEREGKEREVARRGRVRAQGDVAEGGEAELELRSAKEKSSVATRFRLPCQVAAA